MSILSSIYEFQKALKVVDGWHITGKAAGKDSEWSVVPNTSSEKGIGIAAYTAWKNGRIESSFEEEGMRFIQKATVARQGEVLPFPGDSYELSLEADLQLDKRSRRGETSFTGILTTSDLMVSGTIGKGKNQLEIASIPKRIHHIQEVAMEWTASYLARFSSQGKLCGSLGIRIPEQKCSILVEATALENYSLALELQSDPVLFTKRQFPSRFSARVADDEISARLLVEVLDETYLATSFDITSYASSITAHFKRLPGGWQLRASLAASPNSEKPRIGMELHHVA